MTIAVDFDGTIVEHRYPAIGKERPFACDTLRRLAADGHQLILWTAREGELLDQAVQFCKERGVEFFAVNSDGPMTEFEGASVARKLRVDLFIDDRNLGGIPDWPTIYDMVSRRLTFGDLIKQATSEMEDDEEDDRSFFQRLRDRMRESRSRVGHSDGHHHHHHSSRHW